MALKLVMLRAVQARTFRKADGVIFLTTYARDAVLAVTGPLRGLVAMIPHGIAERFFLAPRPQRETAAFTDAEPCRVLYVSVVDEYKHQWHVADAVMRLRAEGVPIELDLVGPPGIAMPRLRAALSTLDPTAKTIHSRGAAAYDELHSMYASADIGLFASSCENMPNILLEGMAAGLPMACSARGPMPEILQDAGVYFDPEEPATIADALRRLIDSPTLRAALATAAFEQAHAFSWRRCARETFAFLSAVRDASPRAAR
jgi:glycosyltransferase involved in cell wall biosynthesis